MEAEEEEDVELGQGVVHQPTVQLPKGYGQLDIIGLQKLAACPSTGVSQLKQILRGTPLHPMSARPGSALECLR